MRSNRDVVTIDLPLVESAQHYLQDCLSRRTPAPEHVLAWDVFFKRCDKLIRRYAGMRGMRNSDLDDCAQAVWIKLIVLLSEFQYDPKRGQFETWLYTIVRSAVVKLLRQRRAQNLEQGQWSGALAAVEISDPSARLCEDESRHRAGKLLEQARENLSPQNYRLFMMRCMQDQSVARVAEALGIGPEQVWFRQHRLKKKLREVFAELAPAG